MAQKINPLTEGHRGPDMMKKGYQGGEVRVVNVERPAVSDPRGGTPAQGSTAPSQVVAPTTRE